MSEPKYRYRPNVAAIVQNSEGRILICERIDIPGAWQFPQGGIDDGETPEEALVREVGEELSLSARDYRVLSQKSGYRYLIGEGRMKRGYHGQEQTYFLLELTVPESRIDLETKHQEFRDMRWIKPAKFDLRWLPTMKQEVYRSVLTDFFGVKLELPR